MYALAGAVAIAMVTGWARGLLLPPLEGPLVAVPWSWLRRALLGLLYDLPAGAAVTLACLAVGRLASLRPVRASAALLGLVWALDALVAALVSHDMRLWTDPFVLAGRLPVVAATLLLSARALARGRATEPGKEDDGDEDAPPESESDDDEPPEPRGADDAV